MGRKRSDEEDLPPFETEELALPGQIGSVTTVTEVPKKRRQKIMRRRIGFLVDIDELVEAE